MGVTVRMTVRMAVGMAVRMAFMTVMSVVALGVGGVRGLCHQRVWY